ncbi:MAG TPA: hypothetical protein VMU88_05975 [bacterium]|nr:hypothetical protein [bacterium]
MERVVARALEPLAGGKPVPLPAQGAQTPVPGVIEKTIRPGEFWARLDAGQRVQVRSQADLSQGQKVAVLMPARLAERAAVLAPPAAPAAPGLLPGTAWTAFIPLDWGDGQSTAKLEVFTEKSRKHSLEKGERASYLVFTTDFKDGGRVQWSVYLKNRNVSLQIYCNEEAARRHDLGKLAEELEKRLKKLGFCLVSPTLKLKRPFRAPEGFRLNVRA